MMRIALNRVFKFLVLFNYIYVSNNTHEKLLAFSKEFSFVLENLLRISVSREL